jgi:hypothetical protein
MRKPLFALCVLVLGVLACGQYITPTPTPSALGVPTDTQTPPTQTAIIPTATRPTPNADTATVSSAVVVVRDAPNGIPTGAYLEAGQSVTVIACADEWCQIADPAGYVWAGCLAEYAGNLKCEARQ